MLEGYDWNFWMVLGLPMILAGNFVIFFPVSRSRSKLPKAN
jgi:hypothetical protein